MFPPLNTLYSVEWKNDSEWWIWKYVEENFFVWSDRRTLDIYIYIYIYIYKSGLLSSVSEYTHKITTPCDKSVHLGVANFLQICEKGCMPSDWAYSPYLLALVAHLFAYTVVNVFQDLIESYVVVNSFMFGDNHCNMSNVLAFRNTVRLTKCTGHTLLYPFCSS